MPSSPIVPFFKFLPSRSHDRGERGEGWKGGRGKEAERIQGGKEGRSKEEKEKEMEGERAGMILTRESLSCTPFIARTYPALFIFSILLLVLFLKILLVETFISGWPEQTRRVSGAIDRWEGSHDGRLSVICLLFSPSCGRRTLRCRAATSVLFAPTTRTERSKKSCTSRGTKGGKGGQRARLYIRPVYTDANSREQLFVEGVTERDRNERIGEGEVKRMKNE